MNKNTPRKQLPSGKTNGKKTLEGKKRRIAGEFLGAIQSCRTGKTSPIRRGVVRGTGVSLEAEDIP